MAALTRNIQFLYLKYYDVVKYPLFTPVGPVGFPRYYAELPDFQVPNFLIDASFTTSCIYIKKSAIKFCFLESGIHPNSNEKWKKNKKRKSYEKKFTAISVTRNVI